MSENPFQDSDDIDLSTEEMDTHSDPGTLDDMPDLQESQGQVLDGKELDQADLPDNLDTPAATEPPISDLPPNQFEESTPSDLGDQDTPEQSEPDDLGDMDTPEEPDTSDDLPAVSFQDDFDYSGAQDTPDTSVAPVTQLPVLSFNDLTPRSTPGTGYKTAGTYFGY